MDRRSVVGTGLAVVAVAFALCGMSSTQAQTSSTAVAGFGSVVSYGAPALLGAPISGIAAQRAWKGLLVGRLGWRGVHLRRCPLRGLGHQRGSRDTGRGYRSLARRWGLLDLHLWRVCPELRRTRPMWVTCPTRRCFRLPRSWASLRTLLATGIGWWAWTAGSSASVTSDSTGRWEGSTSTPLSSASPPRLIVVATGW